MVDSSDAERFQLARETLQEVLADDRLASAPLLVLSNKVDVSNATTQEIVQALNIQSLRRSWYVQPTCALNGQGIVEGLEWLAKEVKNGKRTRASE